MDLRKNKRGIFFMTLAIVVISLFVLSITFFSGFALRKSIQKRVESLSEFVISVEEDLPRQLFITGYRSIFFMEREVVNNGYLDSTVEDVFQETFFNGTINQQPETLLASATFDEIELNIQERANKISADIELSNPSVNMTQEDPWNVKITLTADLFVRDKNGLASWNKTIVSVSYISIGNFTDPVYLAGTGGDFTPNIIRTPFTSFGVDEINSHLDNGYYKAHNGAPSFIDRLEGNFDVSNIRYPDYGVESLVDGSNPNIPSYSRSSVDYLYFESSASGCHVSGTPPWFRLDNEHLDDYGVSC